VLHPRVVAAPELVVCPVVCQEDLRTHMSRSTTLGPVRPVCPYSIPRGNHIGKHGRGGTWVPGRRGGALAAAGTCEARAHVLVVVGSRTVEAIRGPARNSR
jgi:hypothetical protein